MRLIGTSSGISASCRLFPVASQTCTLTIAIVALPPVGKNPREANTAPGSPFEPARGSVRAFPGARKRFYLVSGTIQGPEDYVVIGLGHCHAELRYSEASGRCVGLRRCFGVPQHD